MTLSLFPPSGPSSPNAALRAFETALANAREASRDGSELDQTRETLLRALATFGPLTGPTEGGTDDVVRALLAEPGNNQIRGYVAACVVRLLAEPAMACLFDKDWRPSVVRLLDTQLHEVYPQDIEALQGHEKLERLSRCQLQAEEELRCALSTLTSLERLGAVRQEVMACLRRKMNRPLLRPFLPENIESQIGEIATRFSSYSELREDAGALEELQALSEERDALTRDLEQFGTEYSGWFITLFARPLAEMLREEYKKSAAAQPARVNLALTGKTFPLHLGGAHTLDVPIVVKNDGPGYAGDVSLLAVVNAPGTARNPEITLGRIRPLTSQRVQFAIELSEPVACIQMLVQLSWTNFDGRTEQSEHSCELRAQRAGIDWDRARETAPYSLEPVESDTDLVGRKDVLARLTQLIKAPAVGSAIIFGQKRVGKTSIAKSLRSQAKSLGCGVIYLEGGEYVDPSASMTIKQLGRRVARAIKREIPSATPLPDPEFSESIAPLVEFIDDTLASSASDIKTLIILDEFDELPTDLYDRGPTGNAFFLGLRSLTSRPLVGVVLVGGEKMRHVMDRQGDKLNKWSFVPVDYFSRESDWLDFKELVQRPTAGILDFGEPAIEALFEVTAGNPYFTHLVCQHLFNAAVSRQDCHVTDIEVEQAVAASVSGTERNSYQHFWEDGIIDVGIDAAERSVRRRRTLIALADSLADASPCSTKVVASHPLVRHFAVEPELRELLSRKVLKGDAAQGLYDFSVPLFLRWLRGRGVGEILTTFEDWDDGLQKRRRDEELKVKPGEVLELISGWGPYKGQIISEQRVHAWIEQFGGPREQRLMFRILQNVSFFGSQFVRKQMQDLKDVVRSALAARIGNRATSEREIIVSYLDGPARSGAHLARVYTEASGLRAEDVVERGSLHQRIRDDELVRAVVVLDDFVGTGASAADGLRRLNDDFGDLVRTRDIKIIFGAAVATEQGWRKLQEVADELRFGVRLHCGHFLDESHRMFSDESVAFPDPDDRGEARALALRFGGQLEKRCPLGFGELELAVVFERGCPNNSLPILWSESRRAKWRPLFKRH